jgi:hypothetical protein
MQARALRHAIQQRRLVRYPDETEDSDRLLRIALRGSPAEEAELAVELSKPPPRKLVRRLLTWLAG